VKSGRGKKLDNSMGHDDVGWLTSKVPLGALLCVTLSRDIRK
jgi:hypothetical protein